MNYTKYFENVNINLIRDQLDRMISGLKQVSSNGISDQIMQSNIWQSRSSEVLRTAFLQNNEDINRAIENITIFLKAVTKGLAVKEYQEQMKSMTEYEKQVAAAQEVERIIKDMADLINSMETAIILKISKGLPDYASEKLTSAKSKLATKKTNTKTTNKTNTKNTTSAIGEVGMGTLSADKTGTFATITSFGTLEAGSSLKSSTKNFTGLTSSTTKKATGTTKTVTSSATKLNANSGTAKTTQTKTTAKENYKPETLVDPSNLYDRAKLIKDQRKQLEQELYISEQRKKQIEESRKAAAALANQKQVLYNKAQAAKQNNVTNTSSSGSGR